MTPTNPAAGTPPVTRRVPPPEGGPAPVPLFQERAARCPRRALLTE